jgi:hypothetical protein
MGAKACSVCGQGSVLSCAFSGCTAGSSIGCPKSFSSFHANAPLSPFCSGCMARISPAALVRVRASSNTFTNHSRGPANAETIPSPSLADQQPRSKPTIMPAVEASCRRSLISLQLATNCRATKHDPADEGSNGDR